jgi:hypothetical protein
LHQVFRYAHATPSVALKFGPVRKARRGDTLPITSSRKSLKRQPPPSIAVFFPPIASSWKITNWNQTKNIENILAFDALKGLLLRIFFERPTTSPTGKARLRTKFIARRRLSAYKTGVTAIQGRSFWARPAIFGT